MEIATMAVLSAGDRAIVEVLVNRDASVIQGVGITKPELRAAIDAIDDWVETNAGVFNTAVPQPARSALTARQKAALLMYVVEKRFGVL
jgi:hypothetical protein